MAANFWNSSHYKQLLDPEEVDVVHDLDKERGISIDDFKLIKFHMSNHIMKLAQHIKVRQRVVATAITYMRRVYIRKSMVEFEPRLVAFTCLYLASKAEESIVQARNLVFNIKILYLQDAAINDVNMNQITWGIVNDTYKMDLILVHPPYRIALACIYIASVHREKDITAWFEDLHEDMNLVKNIVMEILDFYENYRTITEEKVNSAFNLHLQHLSHRKKKDYRLSQLPILALWQNM
ncbi:PREDICTED: cyclin-C1-1-like isoform X3 [Camelina sativa]|uniref:Cyclin-C1-1-like isoform X3 n=1 Tax=Camelina sativa TaxID=90675 RepID=A0ABM1RE19_CAMSA|nr:PREDICTED: cyclin-C1-1-like isoform X3 [Camelina sativa]